MYKNPDFFNATQQKMHITYRTIGESTNIRREMSDGENCFLNIWHFSAAVTRLFSLSGLDGTNRCKNFSIKREDLADDDDDDAVAALQTDARDLLQYSGSPIFKHSVKGTSTIVPTL